MKLAKWFSGLAIVFLLLSLVVTVGAAPSGNDVLSASTIVRSGEVIGADRPSGAGGGGGPDKTPPVVSILSPSQSAVVSGSVLISATATDETGIKKVEYRIDGAGWTEMANVEGDTYEATWDSTTVADGDYTITVRARDNRNNKGQDSVTVTTNNGIGPPPPPPPTAEYELFIEIDYMEGHEPTQDVLDYIKSYYMGNNPSGDLIEVTFDISDQVVDPTSGTGITDADFWAIEAAYNDGADNAGGNPNRGKYYSKEKWVLYGTNVEAYPDVVGYCYIVVRGFIQQDCVAGNYIFVADEAADSWAVAALGAGKEYAAEAVVLMHEMGHSIGIGEFIMNMEIYDPDLWSVMSLLWVNATVDWGWYYSSDYWATRNMKYYEAA